MRWRWKPPTAEDAAQQRVCVRACRFHRVGLIREHREGRALTRGDADEAILHLPGLGVQQPFMTGPVMDGPTASALSQILPLLLLPLFLELRRTELPRVLSGTFVGVLFFVSGSPRRCRCSRSTACYTRSSGATFCRR